MIKPNELKFLEDYENAKQRIRSRKEFEDFAGDIRAIFNGTTNSRKYLRGIEIIQEAVKEACHCYNT